MQSLNELSNLINKIYFFTYASMKNRKCKKKSCKKSQNMFRNFTVGNFPLQLFITFSHPLIDGKHVQKSICKNDNEF